MKLYVAAMLLTCAGFAFAEDNIARTVPIDVLAIPLQIPLVDRPLAIGADALTSSSPGAVPSPAAFSSNLQANSSQLGAVGGTTISNLGQGIFSAIAPAGPALTLGNVVGAPRTR